MHAPVDESSATNEQRAATAQNAGEPRSSSGWYGLAGLGGDADTPQYDWGLNLGAAPAPAVTDTGRVVPWEGDSQPAISRDQNHFGIEPSSPDGFFAESAPASRLSLGDNAALSRAVANDPVLRGMRNAQDDLMVQRMPVANAENRQRTLMNFQADAARASALEAAEAQATPQAWGDRDNLVASSVARTWNDAAIAIGRDYPVIGGGLQAVRHLTIGNGTNSDVLWAAGPKLLGGFAKAAGKALRGVDDGATLRTVGGKSELGNAASTTPGSGFVRFSEDFDTHILSRDFGVPAKRGIGGAHNLDEFMKYSNEFKIVGTANHPTVDGIQTISYQVAARDPAGKFTGAFRDKVFEKTVFDPSVISPDTFLTWGRQAAAEGQALAPLNRTWTGTAPNGLKFMGYLDDTGAVRSFFPDF